MERIGRRLLLQNATRFGRRFSEAPILAQWRLASSSAAPSSPGRVASRRLYRILQRQCLELKEFFPTLPSGETMFLIQPTLKASQSGTHRILAIKTVSPQDDVRNLLLFFRDWNEDNGEEDVHDWFATIQNTDARRSLGAVLPLDHDFTDEPTIWATASSVQKTIRHAFQNAKSDEGNRPMMNKYAIRALSMLMEQCAMHRLTSVSLDKDVRVVATSKHTGTSHVGTLRGGRLRGGRSKYRFNYRIRIENLSDQETVQLLGRSWRIEDLGTPGEPSPEDDNPIIVDAPNGGAVGQLPVLHPGDAFEYMSGCDLTTSRGVMQGSFHLAYVPRSTPSATLQNVVAALTSDSRFEVEVRPFSLIAVPVQE